MESFAFLAIIAAALLHACWNFILKDAGDKVVCTVIIYLTSLPFAMTGMLIAGLPSIDTLPIIVLSATLQTGYCVVLFKGYQLGDLSSVYPIARGSAPIFVFVVSLLFFEASYELTTFLGIFVFCVGLLTYAFSVIRNTGSRLNEIAYALAIGLFIAGYSITDAIGTRLVGNALSFFGAMAIFNRLFLIGYLYNFEEGMFQRLRKGYDNKFVLAGLFAFFCYAVILWAYTVLPMSVVTTLRESSVVFAVLLGVLVLGESFSKFKALMLFSTAAGFFLLLS